MLVRTERVNFAQEVAPSAERRRRIVYVIHIESMRLKSTPD